MTPNLEPGGRNPEPGILTTHHARLQQVFDTFKFDILKVSNTAELCTLLDLGTRNLHLGTRNLQLGTRKPEGSPLNLICKHSQFINLVQYSSQKDLY